MLATEATSHSCIVSMTMVLLPLVSFSQAITAFPVLWRWIKGVGVNFFSNFLPSTDLVSCGQTAFSVYAGVVNRVWDILHTTVVLSRLEFHVTKSCVCYSLISICTVIYQLLAVVFINSALGQTLWLVSELVSNPLELLDWIKTYLYNGPVLYIGLYLPCVTFTIVHMQLRGLQLFRITLMALGIT